MKTAMQEFIQRLQGDYGIFLSLNVTELYLNLEKQQIIKSAKHGANFDKSTFKNAEDYYNETYK